MHSVKEFVEEVFNYLDLDWKKYIKIDKRYFRPTEVDELQCDASKAKEKPEWMPKVTFKELIKIMVDADMKLAEREKIS